MVKVVVKWQKNKYDLEIDQESPLDLVKAQLFDLSGVPVERQKILCRGKVLKEDSDLKKLKNNQKLMMMGTATALPKAPKQPVVFKEDLPEVQHEDAIPSGLKNLGNTCYMNSVIQCLRGIPEFKEAAMTFSKRNPSSEYSSMTVPQALGDLYNKMDSTTDAVPPFVFWHTLKRVYPMFAETTPQGVPKQQDADECYSNVMTYCRHDLKVDESKEKETRGNIVDDLFTIELEETLKCLDNEEEPGQTTTKTSDRLRCNIKDNKISHAHTGILDSLEQVIEKKGQTSDINMQWQVSQRITKLPQYICLQFVRFTWKQDIQKKAKVNRKIVFPVEKFDIYDFCAPKLREQIGALRQRRLAEQDAAREARQSGEAPPSDDKDKASSSEGEPAEKKEKTEASSDSAAMDVEKPSDGEPASAPADGSAMDVSDDETQESGFYELRAIVTHKGLSADSGHYIGWVKQGKNDWLKFDDDKVSQCDDDEIKRLYGGGQWDNAYLCFFKKMEDF